jgi:hypothetical protein
MYKKCTKNAKFWNLNPFSIKKIAHFFLLTDKDEHFTKMQ